MRSGSVGLTDLERFLTVIGVDPSKVQVNTKSATGLTAYLGSVRVIAGIFASQPVGVLQKVDGRRKSVVGHPLQYALEVSANEHQRPAEMLETLIVNVLFSGNGVARLTKDKYRRTTEIRSYDWNELIVYELKDALFYRFPDGQVLPESEVIHLRWMNVGKKVSPAPWGYTQKAIRIALSAHEFIDKYYQNGTFLGGLLTSEAGLDEAKAKAAKKMWNESARPGVQNSGDIVVLGNGLKFQEIGSKPLESQLVEFFSKTDLDIYRLLGVQPHLVADATKNNTWGGTGIESQFVGFMNTTMAIYIRKFEQEFRYKALRYDEVTSSGMYIKMNLNNLLRPEAEKRYTIYQKAIAAGMLTQNQALELEDMDGFDEGGDHWMQQGFMPMRLAEEVLLKKTKGNGNSTGKTNS